MKSRRKFTADFKARIALEAIKGQQTLAELSARYELTQSQIANWKKEFLSKASLVFTQEAPEEVKDKGQELYADSAYVGKEETLEKYEVKDRICEKGYRGHPLTEEQKENNRLKSKMRSRVEHTAT